MAFSHETMDAAYRRAGGRCECTLSTCGHHTEHVRCNASLANGWHAHHKHPVSEGGGDNLSNCLALCPPCYANAKAQISLHEASFHEERPPVSAQE